MSRLPIRIWHRWIEIKRWFANLPNRHYIRGFEVGYSIKTDKILTKLDKLENKIDGYTQPKESSIKDIGKGRKG